MPNNWPAHLKTCILHVAALAHMAMTCARGWALNSRIQRGQRCIWG
jgi:hypothetical protein